MPNPYLYSSKAAAHSPSHGGYPDAAPAERPEPTQAECATRLGFENVDQMVAWLQGVLR